MIRWFFIPYLFIYFFTWAQIKDSDATMHFCLLPSESLIYVQVKEGGGYNSAGD